MRNSYKKRSNRLSARKTKDVGREDTDSLIPAEFQATAENLMPVQCVSKIGKSSQRGGHDGEEQEAVKPELSTAFVTRLMSTSQAGWIHGDTHPSAILTDRNESRTCHARDTDDLGLPASPVGNLGPRTRKASRLAQRPASAPVHKMNQGHRSTAIWSDGKVIFKDPSKRQSGSSSFLATGRDQVQWAHTHQSDLGPGQYDVDVRGQGKPQSLQNLKAIQSEYTNAGVHTYMKDGKMAGTDQKSGPNGKSQAVFVHPRPKSSSGGTSSFKVSTRDGFRPQSAASHLSAHQYNPKHDLTRARTLSLVAKFNQSTCREVSARMKQSCHVSALLGPGFHFSKAPGTYTGKHIRAGHAKDSRTLDFSRCSARPGSAPVLPNQKAVEVVQPWINNMDPQDDGFIYNDDVSSCENEDNFDCDDIPQEHPLESASQGIQQQKSGSSSPKPPGLGPGSYLGPDTQYSSTGFRSRPKGGYMTQCDRESEIKGMKVMGTPKIALPATAPKVNNDTAQLDYSPCHSVQAHRRRAPSWTLPQNSVEKSKNWLFSGSTSAL